LIRIKVLARPGVIVELSMNGGLPAHVLSFDDVPPIEVQAGD